MTPQQFANLGFKRKFIHQCIIMALWVVKPLDCDRCELIEDIAAYLKLTDKIATSGQPRQAQLSDIAAAGYQVVINLALTGTEYSLPDESGAVRELGMEYIHIPVVWKEPTHQNLEDFITSMDACSGKKVFLHCAANMRVSAFMALYRIKRLSWDPEAAFQDMLKIWRPDGVWAEFIRSEMDDEISVSR
jgi:uncharacterized protein (TIGR01244 family)